MTLLELLPWLFAFCVAALTGTLLTRSGPFGPAAWVLALAAGVASFAAYWAALKYLDNWLERRRVRMEKWEREHREYQNFDSAKPPPPRKNLFYECGVCGNVIPSTARKSVSCICRNITIDADSHRIEIRDHAKVKLFSLATS
jgi:hypothetical protein